MDQLNLEGLDNWTEDQQGAAKDLLVDSADVLSKEDLDLGKCKILKHDFKITDPQLFKERYKRIPPHLYEEVKAHLQEMVEVGAIRRSFRLISPISPFHQCGGAGQKKRWRAQILH